MAASLKDLGWSRHFQTQTEADDTASYGRVGEVHRTQITVRTPEEEIALVLEAGRSTGEIAVGDWVRFDPEKSLLLEVFERKTALHRRAPGTSGTEQLIAANVDTLFIVTSCNADFNPARLERYLTLASAGGIIPVIVLTKADLSDDADDLRRQAERLSPLATAISVNALDATSLEQLSFWLKDGDTGVLVGSSGVGKSTILNTLTGADFATQGVREDDAKGRHTTTARSLRQTRGGGWLIDTPGIRQLSLTGSADAIDEVFADVADLLGNCKFSDCAHEVEPGCAILAAIDEGSLDPERLRRWRKLHLENSLNSETAQETRSRQKTFSKHVRTAVGGKRGAKRSQRDTD